MIILLANLFVSCLVLSAPGQTKLDYSVSLPEKIEGLEGACVLIPCTFSVPDFNAKLKKAGSVHAMWIKGGPNTRNIVFNSTRNTIKEFDKIQILGNLHVRNCTSVFYNVQKKHNDEYFFRIEKAFNATFIDKSFHLTVKDTLAGPQLSQVSEVSEGTSVNLTCTAAAPCPSQPPTITWSLPAGNTHTHIQDKEDATKSLVSFLTFTASRSHHGREISCTASYHRQNGSTVLLNSTAQTLRVLFSPEDVVASVSPSGPVAEDTSVTLTCSSSEANPPVQNYSWFRLDQQHTPIGSGLNLTFNLSSSAVGLYYCRAEHPQGGKKSDTVRLMIKGLTWSLVIGSTIKCLAAFLITVLVIDVVRWKKSLEEKEQNGYRQKSGPDEPGEPTRTDVGE